MLTLREILIVSGLAAFSVLAGWQIAGQLGPRAGGQAGSPATIQGQGAPGFDIAIAEFSPMPLGTYAQLTARPLFEPARRPFAPQATVLRVAPAARPPLSVNVNGVVIAGSERIVLVSAPGQSETTSLSTGETFEGWTLTEIREDGVSFERDGERVEVGLSYSSDAAK